MNGSRFINLGIGEMYLSSEATIVSTILGSCVSVCLFSQRTGVGGITHFALPDRSYATNSNRNDLNFGETAIDQLYHEILKVPGVEKKDLVAKIVGGASVVSLLTHAHSIGELNVDISRTILQNLKVEIVGEHIGGFSGRKVFFYTDSGRLRVSKIGAAISDGPIKSIGKKVRILIVDDSKTMRDLLSKILTNDEIEVVGKAANATQAIQLIKDLLPDVITLDIHMPIKDGVTFFKEYLATYPIPTIMISSISMNESDLILKALEIGAVDYIKKPSLAEIASKADFIRRKIITASSIKVIKPLRMDGKQTKKISYSCGKDADKVVVIGASTGGTEAIKMVLVSLPKNIPPIVIVQHIPPVFSTAFAKRLNELCPFEVKEASDGDEVLPGRVLIAPGGKQMDLIVDQGKRRVRVFEGEKVNGHRPSVDVLFNSAAKVLGKDAVGVILTGMGSDGAKGLLEMKKKNAFTIGQDEESSVVYGMPKAAFNLKAVTQVCSLSEVHLCIMKVLENTEIL